MGNLTTLKQLPPMKRHKHTLKQISIHFEGFRAKEGQSFFFFFFNKGVGLLACKTKLLIIKKMKFLSEGLDKPHFKFVCFFLSF